jgi:hypothetical protein
MKRWGRKKDHTGNEKESGGRRMIVCKDGTRYTGRR